MQPLSTATTQGLLSRHLTGAHANQLIPHPEQTAHAVRRATRTRANGIGCSGWLSTQRAGRHLVARAVAATMDS